MKYSIKSMIFGGTMFFALSICFTSCEGTLDDIFGEWDKPSGGDVTPSSEGGGSSTINATAITLDQKMKVIKLGGDALTINVTFTPSDATDKSVTWESDKETVATVNNGVVAPVGLGIATITAKSGELKATCEVFVGTEVDDVSARNPIQNWDILAGTQNTASITIPDGCHVAFNGVNTDKGIICSGHATIYLTDGSTNDVTGTVNNPGIKAGGAGTTLTINAETLGTGTLTVQGDSYAAGIGTGYANNATVTGGSIEINGGTINATGGNSGAGIGTGLSHGSGPAASNTCGAITINGGTVTAKGGNSGAGIGTGESFNFGAATSNECGDITIGTGVTSVTATKGTGSPNSIGKGTGSSQTCGTISIADPSKVTEN